MFNNSTYVSFVSVDTDGREWALAIFLYQYLQISETVFLHKPFFRTQAFFLDKTSLSCTVHSVCHLSLDYPRLTCPHNCCCCHTETWIHKVMLGKNWASGWHGQKQIARKYRAWARKCLRNHSLKHSLHLCPEDEVVLVQVMEYTINGFYRPWNL